jgi:hypothetical protein
MPSAGLEPATPALGRRRSGPLSYEGMLPAARQREVIIDIRQSGRSSARLECSVRDREVGSSNLLAPTPFLNRDIAFRRRERAPDGSPALQRLRPAIEPAEGARSGATLPTGCEVRPPGRGVPTWKAPSPSTTFAALRAALHCEGVHPQACPRRRHVPMGRIRDRPNLFRHADVRGHHWGRDVVPRPARPDHLSAKRALITRGSATRCRRGWRELRPRGSRPRDAPPAARFPRP